MSAKRGSEASWSAFEGVDGLGGCVRGRRRGGGQGGPVEQELGVPVVLCRLLHLVENIRHLLLLLHPAVPRRLDADGGVVQQVGHDVPLPLFLAAGGQGRAGLETDGAGADRGGGGGGGDVEQLGLSLTGDRPSCLFSFHTGSHKGNGKGDGN